jgi:hypothetical protein
LMTPMIHRSLREEELGTLSAPEHVVHH